MDKKYISKYIKIGIILAFIWLVFWDTVILNKDIFMVSLKGMGSSIFFWGVVCFWNKKKMIGIVLELIGIIIFGLSRILFNISLLTQMFLWQMLLVIIVEIIFIIRGNIEVRKK